MIPFAFNVDDDFEMRKGDNDVDMIGQMVYNGPERAGTDDAVEWQREHERRSSKSPEFAGGITLLSKDGRPISRGEVIERLKRGESPTWTVRHNWVEVDGLAPIRTETNVQLAVLPAAMDRGEERMEESLMEARRNGEELDATAAGIEIERPRSALHSGDFRLERDHGQAAHDVHGHDDRYSHADNALNSVHHHSAASDFATSPRASWATRSFFPGPKSFTRTEPCSSPLSGKLLLATSPLFHAYSTNPERPRSPSPSASPITLSPSSSTRPIPFQAHQPRRSIFIPYHAGTAPYSPPTNNFSASYAFGLRRPRGMSTSFSHATDNALISSSPVNNRAPMVGSYEESILRGRMSAPPSRPLSFIAQIGVLGRGKCRPSLRCPPHVSVAFPAVFYNYPGTAPHARNALESPSPASPPRVSLLDQPSPYVGLIDVENAFPTYDKPSLTNDGSVSAGIAPRGGCYRIPQTGQLQIVIKNPNKTAVKLFLVPYDLSDMLPGQKTFIRQRSFSLPSDGIPDGALPTVGLAGRERPTLRYLIHLHICCPARGRYFLYRAVRVVFANRVPDGNERLRNEVQWPEPKYSAWNKVRESFGSVGGHNSHLQHATNRTSFGDATAGANERAADVMMRRRSTPVAFKFNNGGHYPTNPASSLDTMSSTQNGHTTQELRETRNVERDGDTIMKDDEHASQTQTRHGAL